MADRKSISKKLRFEVFKRDSFTCQYCGRMAPDVVLEIDHINPVSKGGTNDILNLVTSCTECNRGKSDRTLDDSSVVVVQQKQLAEMNERRVQLQMMIEWRNGLAEILETQVDAIDSIFLEMFGRTLTTNGRIRIKALIKRFGFSEVCEGADIACAKYETAGEAFQKIGGVCYNRKHGIGADDYGY